MDRFRVKSTRSHVSSINHYLDAVPEAAQRASVLAWNGLDPIPRPSVSAQASVPRLHFRGSTGGQEHAPALIPLHGWQPVHST